jgi:hypothetical protein
VDYASKDACQEGECGSRCSSCFNLDDADTDWLKYDFTNGQYGSGTDFDQPGCEDATCYSCSKCDTQWMFMYELAPYADAAAWDTKTYKTDGSGDKILYTNDEAGQELCKMQQCIYRGCEKCVDSFADNTVYPNNYASIANCQTSECGDADKA